jgi:hypothetical protein
VAESNDLFGSAVSTVATERAHNVHIRDGVSEDEFVRMRTAHDAKLGMPELIMPSVQVNMRAGEFPPADSDGQTYLALARTVSDPPRDADPKPPSETGRAAEAGIGCMLSTFCDPAEQRMNKIRSGDGNRLPQTLRQSNDPVR